MLPFMGSVLTGFYIFPYNFFFFFFLSHIIVLVAYAQFITILSHNVQVILLN